jgi:glycosyltransferase involved in cell wall biosynthesis
MTEKVEIHLCSLNEAKLIERTLLSLHSQTMEADIVLLDSGSTDGTIDIARPYVKRITDCPRGKLTSRDYGVRMSDADIIFAADSDTYYPPETVELMVRPLLDDGSIVCTGGRTVYDNPFAQMIGDGFLYGELALGFHHLSGHNSAFRRDAYLAAGGFKLDINQKDLPTVHWEEEVTFGNKMCKVTGGRFVFVPRSVVHASDRRIDPLKNFDFFKQIMAGERF